MSRNHTSRNPFAGKHNRPVTFIIGAGFAGLTAARHLAKSKTDVLLMDRTNHHLFQPLLYQVATAALSPAQIAQPIRRILKKQKNCLTGMAEVKSIDTDKNLITTSKSTVAYDYLVLATGTTHTYFGHENWEKYAPGLKTIDDALLVRQRILDAFEKAETCTDPKEREALLTFVLVGGGPTGVEMAGAIAELAQHTLKDEFRFIDTSTARVVLVEAGPRILSAFPDKLSDKALKDIEGMGVEVRLNEAVTDCHDDGVQIGETFIPSKTVVWSAGVKASPAAKWIHAPADKAGRIEVDGHLQVKGYENVFAIGDTACVVDANGVHVPGLAPAAVQQGQYIAKVINSKLTGKALPKPFVYRDAGIMATIGRGKAIARIYGMFSLTGLLAWLTWCFIHIMPLVGFRNRVVIACDWAWSYFTGGRGVRLITAKKQDSHRQNKA